MRYLAFLVLLLATLPVISAPPAKRGRADLRLSLTLLPEPSLAVGGASAPEGQDAASIRIGDPVSIRIRLWNAGDADSEPTVRLSPLIAPLSVIVQRPDGSTVHAPWEWRSSGVRRAIWASPEPLRPSEEDVFETFLYETRIDDPETWRPTTEYLFEKAGRYEVHVEYWAGDPAEHWKFRRGERADPPPVLRSTPVVLDVTEPPIPGWEELKDAQILHFIGKPHWPALVDATSPINATIDAADRPWLDQWRDRLLAAPLEKSATPDSSP